MKVTTFSQTTKPSKNKLQKYAKIKNSLFNSFQGIAPFAKLTGSSWSQYPQWQPAHSGEVGRAWSQGRATTQRSGQLEGSHSPVGTPHIGSGPPNSRERGKKWTSLQCRNRSGSKSRSLIHRSSCGHHAAGRGPVGNSPGPKWHSTRWLWASKQQGSREASRQALITVPKKSHRATGSQAKLTLLTISPEPWKTWTGRLLKMPVLKQEVYPPPAPHTCSPWP